MEEKKTLKEKFSEFKENFSEKAESAMKWAMDNKEIVAIGGTIIIGGFMDLVKTIARSGESRNEQSLRDDYIYDRSNGHYYRLKHIRSDRKRNRIYSEIDTRKRLGEPLNEILHDMKIMK